jgi:hypothetical protein
MLTDIILFIHLAGLMMGAGGGFGSMLVMRHAATLPPEQQGPFRALGPKMAKFSHIGLALMWITGLMLVFLRYGGLANLPQLFWVKIVFVLSLTLAAITIEMTYADIKRGNVAAAARLPRLGPWAGMSSLLAVLFASLAFH